MIFDLTMEDFTILQNAIHYYKHVEKRGNFKQYDIERCEQLRDKLAHQFVNGCNNTTGSEPDEGTRLGFE